MTATTLFYIIIAILIVNFILDKVLDTLNAKHFNDALPPELADVYDEEEYKRSQKYKATNQRFSNITSAFSLIITLAFALIGSINHEENPKMTKVKHSIAVFKCLYCFLRVYLRPI